MTRTTLISCDVCKNEITLNPTALHFKDGAENQTFDICEICINTKTIPQIMLSLLSNRNPPYGSWTISFEGTAWRFKKKAGP